MKNEREKLRLSNGKVKDLNLKSGGLFSPKNSKYDVGNINLTIDSPQFQG